MKTNPDFSYSLPVNAISDYFIHCDMQRVEPDMTPMKLQKILYLAQANYLASTDHRLFDEPTEAFKHGPVVYKVYATYPGKQIIAARDDNPSGSADQNLPLDVRDFLDRIWMTYKDWSASQLRKLSHEQDPWKNNYVESAYRTEIPDQDMVEYFRKYVPAKERVFHSNVVLVPEGFVESIDEDAMLAQMQEYLG